MSGTPLRRRLLARAARDWRGKLGALLAALVVWWVASSEPQPMTQRSLLVPLAVTGAAGDEVAVGVPARVEVVVSGPSDRMDRLRATDVDATLDLADVDGAFERAIEARVPQTLQVVRVVPTEVIGRLEAVRSAEFPVGVRVAPAVDGRLLTGAEVAPETVVVEARDPVLELVASVVAPVPPEAAEEATVVLVPVDADGRPVPEARVVPETVRIALAYEARRASAARPVALAPLEDPAASVEALAPSAVPLVGPAEALRGIEAVAGRVPAVTGALAPGSYDLPVLLDLPEGVAALEPVVATVRIAPPPAAEEAPRTEDEARPAAGP